MKSSTELRLRVLWNHYISSEDSIEHFSIDVLEGRFYDNLLERNSLPKARVFNGRRKELDKSNLAILGVLKYRDSEVYEKCLSDF